MSIKNLFSQTPFSSPFHEGGRAQRLTKVHKGILLRHSIFLVRYSIFCILLSFSTGTLAQDLAPNPFITHLYTADPSAHVWADGRLYLYPSHDIAPPQGAD